MPTETRQTEVLRPENNRATTAVLRFKDERVATVEACVDAGVIIFQDTRVTPSLRVFRFRNTTGRPEFPPVFEEVDVQYLDLPEQFWTACRGEEVGLETDSRSVAIVCPQKFPGCAVETPHEHPGWIGSEDSSCG